MIAIKSKANEPEIMLPRPEGISVKETAGNCSPTHDTASPEKTGKNDSLPSGWAWAKFGSICKVQGGFAFKSMEYQRAGIPLVRISNLVDGQVSFESDTVFLSQS